MDFPAAVFRMLGQELSMTQSQNNSLRYRTHTKTNIPLHSTENPPLTDSPAFIINPHKSLNTSTTIIIFSYSLDYSRDISYLCEQLKIDN